MYFEWKKRGKFFFFSRHTWIFFCCSMNPARNSKMSPFTWWQIYKSRSDGIVLLIVVCFDVFSYFLFHLYSYFLTFDKIFRKSLVDFFLGVNVVYKLLLSTRITMVSATSDTNRTKSEKKYSIFWSNEKWFVCFQVVEPICFDVLNKEKKKPFATMAKNECIQQLNTICFYLTFNQFRLRVNKQNIFQWFLALIRWIYWCPLRGQSCIDRKVVLRTWKTTINLSKFHLIN